MGRVSRELKGVELKSKSLAIFDRHTGKPQVTAVWIYRPTISFWCLSQYRKQSHMLS